jgi:hypothetical protein
MRDHADSAEMSPPLYHGRACACVPAGPGRYALVTHDGRTIGELRWHARQQRWVFVPAANTSFPSGVLADIGVWLRRLQRECPAGSKSP